MRALLFDFGGTLDFPRHWLDRFLAHYRAAGLALTRAQLDLGFDHVTQTAYRTAADLRHFGLAELVAYLVRSQLAYLRESGDAATREVIESATRAGRLSTAAAQIIRAFVAESRAGMAASATVLESLAPRFRMGVVSNFYGNLDRILAEAGLDRYFIAIADSARVGIFKPDAGIFTFALERLGVAAAAAAMVGDSLDKDCAPARQLGITAIWLPGAASAATEAASQTSADADFTIASLAELQDLRWWRE